MFTNSRDVAACFGKEHFNVLRDISDIGLKLEGNALDWFIPTTYEARVGFGTKTLPAIDMTRDGFTILVMGYTGPKAMEFKVRYIEQFNKMEEALRNPAPALPDFTNPVIAARAWADEVEKRQQLALVTAEQQKAIAVMTPKVGVAEVKKWRMRSVRERRTRGR